MKIAEIARTSLGLVGTDPRTPVLALHACASSGGQWQGLADYLRGAYRVAAPDLPGYGRSHLSRPGDLADAADWMEMIIENYDEPMHLVGHSLGAAIALQIAMSRPDMVRSLTLIEPMVLHLLRDGDASDRALFAQLSSLADRIAACVAAKNAAAGMQSYIDFWYGEGAWRQTSEGLKENFARQTGRVASDLAASLAQTWPVTRCNELRCPTLLMMALESPVASLRVTEMVAEAIPGARLAVIPDAGHMVPLTDPHIVAPLVGKHLRSVDRPRFRRSSRRDAVHPLEFIKPRYRPPEISRRAPVT